MRPSTLAFLLVAAIAASPLAALPDAGGGTPSTVATDAGAAFCPSVPLEPRSAVDVGAWAGEAGAKPMPAPIALGSPPQCPARISCSPCDQGDGPCFERPFGSDTCCTSPGGPCFTCPKGTTIYVSTCPCFGDGPSCPSRDQDWYCA